MGYPDKNSSKQDNPYSSGPKRGQWEDQRQGEIFKAGQEANRQRNQLWQPPLTGSGGGGGGCMVVLMVPLVALLGLLYTFVF